jgi:hypothetical protein
LTALILVFEVFAVGAFLIGARGLSGASPAIPGSTAGLLLVAFFASAAVAFGLHGRRGWVPAAARLWALVVAVLLAWLFLGPEHALPLSGTAALPVGAAFVAFCWWLERRLPKLLDAA